MRKSKTPSAHSDQQKSLEIIELASNDIDALTRAFNLISEVCAGSYAQGDETAPEEMLIH